VQGEGNIGDYRWTVRDMFYNLEKSGQSITRCVYKKEIGPQ